MTIVDQFGRGHTRHALEVGCALRQCLCPALAGQQHQTGALGGGHVHFRTQVTNRANDLHDTLHLPLLLREVVSVLALRPLREHQEALGARQILVHLLGQERHEGMQQLQQTLQHVQQHGLSGLLALLILTQQTGLAQLDIPVAEFRPSEIINTRGGQAEVAILHMRGNVTNRIL